MFLRVVYFSCMDPCTYLLTHCLLLDDSGGTVGARRAKKTRDDSGQGQFVRQARGSNSSAIQDRAKRASVRAPIVEASSSDDIDEETYVANEPSVEEEEEEEEEEPEDDFNIDAIDDLNKLPRPEYRRLRRIYPYAAARDEVDWKFHNILQKRVYSEILKPKKVKIAPHRDLDLEYISNTASFPEVYSVLEDMGLIPFVSFNHAFNEDLILQFYSTVYFENDSARSFKWRSGSRVLSGSMNDLADITGYPFFPEPVEGYATVVQHSRNKQALAFAYGIGGTIGRTKGMIPLYHALRQIFRVSLSPKAGSSDEFWGTAIDLLVYAHERRKIDVLDFMFEEMMACVFEKKAGVYAPFIQALIERKHPNLESLARHFLVSLPARNTKFKPIVHPDLVRGKKAKPAPSAARTGASSSQAAPAMDPAGLAQTVMSSPSFSKKEKNMFFAGFNNLFKMC